MINSLLINNSLSWFLSPKSLMLETEGDWRVEMFGEMVIELYSKIININNNCKNNLVIPYKQIHENDFSVEPKICVNHIFELRDALRDECGDLLKHALIHGSFADNSYKQGWSDLDTFFVISNRALTDLKKLLELRTILIEIYTFLKKVDSLCHHGFIFCTEWDLSNYNSYLIPVEALKYSKSLMQDGSILFKFDQNEAVSIKKRFISKLLLFESFVNSGLFKHHKYEDEYLNINLAEYSNRMYQLKYFIETVMTLPAYFSEAIGKPIYKSESFYLHKKFEKNWLIVEKCTKIRDLWPKKEKYPFEGNKIPDWVISILGPNYAREALFLSTQMKESLEKEFNCHE